jgi:hypothetical protein
MVCFAWIIGGTGRLWQTAWELQGNFMIFHAKSVRSITKKNSGPRRTLADGWRKLGRQRRDFENKPSEVSLVRTTGQFGFRLPLIQLNMSVLPARRDLAPGSVDNGGMVGKIPPPLNGVNCSLTSE